MLNKGEVECLLRRLRLSPVCSTPTINALPIGQSNVGSVLLGITEIVGTVCDNSAYGPRKTSDIELRSRPLLAYPYVLFDEQTTPQSDTRRSRFHPL